LTDPGYLRVCCVQLLVALLERQRNTDFARENYLKARPEPVLKVNSIVRSI
jgi:hypothetical protein